MMSNYTEAAQKQYAEQKYAAQTSDAQQAKTGLVIMADQIADASIRINQISEGLYSLGIGLHGPRPEPVDSPEPKQVTADSIQQRINMLMLSIDRLQRSYEGVVR